MAETTKHWKAFERYWSLGEQRSIEKLHQALTTEAWIAAIKEMQTRHAKEALLLQQKRAEWLTGLGLESVTAEAAIRSISEGIRLEQLVRGEPEVQARTGLEGLTNVELD